MSEKPTTPMERTNWTTSAGDSATLRALGHFFFCGWERLFHDGGFAAAAASLVSRGALEEIAIADRFAPLPDFEPDMIYRIWAYRVPETEQAS